MTLLTLSNLTANKKDKPFASFHLSDPSTQPAGTLHKIHYQWRDKSCLKKLRKVKTTIACVVVFFVQCIFLSEISLASNPEYFNKVVSAIYLAEGGARAKVPYGILSVKVSSKEEARRVCYNTVRNNWKRWEAAGKPETYLSFLAKRYAPVGAANDPMGYNKNWLKNVRYFMDFV